MPARAEWAPEGWTGLCSGVGLRNRVPLPDWGLGITASRVFTVDVGAFCGFLGFKLCELGTREGLRGQEGAQVNWVRVTGRVTGGDSTQAHSEGFPFFCNGIA